MECPKCHVKSPGNFCMRCGYIDEETKMKNHQINFVKSDLEKFLKDRYPMILYNQNRKVIFILGPLYFAYLDHFYLSFILGLVDIFLPLYFGTVLENPRMMITIFLINRLLYMMFANALYMYLTKRKIARWKKKYGDDYLKVLHTKKNRNYFLPFLVIALYVVLFIFLNFNH